MVHVDFPGEDMEGHLPWYFTLGDLKGIVLLSANFGLYYVIYLIMKHYDYFNMRARLALAVASHLVPALAAHSLSHRLMRAQYNLVKTTPVPAARTGISISHGTGAAGSS